MSGSFEEGSKKSNLRVVTQSHGEGWPECGEPDNATAVRRVPAGAVGVCVWWLMAAIHAHMWGGGLCVAGGGSDGGPKGVETEEG